MIQARTPGRHQSVCSLCGSAHKNGDRSLLHTSSPKLNVSPCGSGTPQTLGSQRLSTPQSPNCAASPTGAASLGTRFPRSSVAQVHGWKNKRRTPRMPCSCSERAFRRRWLSASASTPLRRGTGHGRGICGQWSTAGAKANPPRSSCRDLTWAGQGSSGKDSDMPIAFTMRLRPRRPIRVETRHMHGLACTLFEEQDAGHAGQEKAFSIWPLYTDPDYGGEVVSWRASWLRGDGPPQSVETLPQDRLGAQPLRIIGVERCQAGHAELAGGPHSVQHQ